MKIYYLYSEVEEVKSYIIDSLTDYNLTKVKAVDELFDINPENSLLILHIDSNENSSIELITELLKEFKNLKVLALANSVNFIEGTKLLQIGVKGYGNVYMHSVLLNQAVDLIMSKNVWIYPELVKHLIKNLTKEEIPTNSDDKLEKLSKHERECAILASDGNSNIEIASLLNVQEVTIKKHLSSVYKKLSLKNRIELALYLSK